MQVVDNNGCFINVDASRFYPGRSRSTNKDVCCPEWGINHNDGRQAMKLVKFALKSALIVVGIISFQVASACSFDAWFDGVGVGSVAANDPNSSEGASSTGTGVPRVGGFCGMEAFGTGHVEDKSPADDESFIARLYYAPELAETPTGVPAPTTIFTAYSDDGATTPLFSVLFDGTNFKIDATAAPGGGVSADIPAELALWNLLEFEWVSGTTGNFWVNADATAVAATTTFAPGTGSVDAVRVGSPTGQGGFTGRGLFDDYQSQRTEYIGPLRNGDANDDGSVNGGDASAIINEFLFNTLGPGFADCNQDKVVNGGDASCVINIFLTQ